MKKLLLLCLSSLWISACQTSINEEANNLTIDLVRPLMSMEDVSDFLDHEGKLILFDSEFCESNDCRRYFESDPGRVKFYKREDLFMRKIERYIEIKLIDTTPEGSYARILVRKGDRYKGRRITL